MVDRPNYCILYGFKPDGSSNLSWGWVVLIILSAIIVNILIYITCKRYMRRRMQKRLEANDINHQINSVVSSYLALRDQNKT